MRPSDLEKLLRDMPPITNPDVLVGNSTGDDAAVYRLDPGQAVVQTLDFSTPIVDDPFDFGAIAAANALSDIYAMGGKPLFALNIVAFPMQRLPLETLELILKGASEMASKAGISVIGGHSIDDPEPKFGMCITGIIHPEKVWRNTGAKPGDLLLLTKPLGTGIISTALKTGLASETQALEAIRSMKQLNALATEILSRYPVNACTDITGFGLAGHLNEITRGSRVNAEIRFQSLPFMQHVKDFALAGAVPGGTFNNLEFYGKWIQWPANLSETEKLMVCDAQTSGGLLVSIPETMAKAACQELQLAGISTASLIGQITSEGEGLITVI
jgi:selenium donor protein